MKDKLLIIPRIVLLIFYFFAVFLGVPAGIVWTCILITSYLGTAWWVGIIIAPIVLIEFVVAISFVLWDKNPIPYWILPE